MVVAVLARRALLVALASVSLLPSASEAPLRSVGVASGGGAKTASVRMHLRIKSSRSNRNAMAVPAHRQAEKEVRRAVKSYCGGSQPALKVKMGTPTLK